MERRGLFLKTRISPLQCLIILNIYNNPSYGYKIFKTIQNEFKAVWDLKTGTFYPALKSLILKKYVYSEKINEKEHYNLTQVGQQLLEEMGERFKNEFTYANKYFYTVIKWFPKELKEQLLKILDCIAMNDNNVYTPFRLFIQDINDKEKKMSLMYKMRDILTQQMLTLNQIIHETKNM